MNWAFQANERYFAILPALRTLDEITWSISRYPLSSYAKGDKVAIWKSGPDAGIYALGEITGFCNAGQAKPNPAQFWSKLAEFDYSYIGKPHAVVKIVRRFP